MEQTTDPAPGPAQRRAVARGVITMLGDGRIALHPAHTDYQIHLACDASLPDGKRARGTVEAEALRIHAASGGGRFIEPVTGEPRIVSGTVLAIDAGNRRVLIDCAIPMWLNTTDEQDFGIFAEGGLVNCHVRSGATFTPASDDGD